MKSLNRFLSSMLMLGCIPSAAFALGSPAQNAKLSGDVTSTSPFQKISVIIQYKHDTTQSQADSVRLNGGSVKQQMHLIHGISADVPAYMLPLVASDPEVSYISIDRKVSAREVPFAAPEYTIEPINAPSAWAKGYIGTGVGIAVIDSGINPVNDLSLSPFFPAFLNNLLGSRIVYNENFVAGEKTTADMYGHGTHVAGLIAGNGANSLGLRYFRTFFGSAPNAHLINLRALDESGQGTDSSVIAAIDRAIALKDKYNIRVINLSLGRPIFESYAQDPLCQAVEQAWKAGIVVVVAAGNDGRDLNLNAEGYGTVNAPGNDPYAITVGAMRTMQTPTVQDDQIASYSSKGPSFIDQVVKPDIVAPGNLVISSKFANDPLSIANPTFITPLSFYQRNGSATTPSTTYFPLSEPAWPQALPAAPSPTSSRQCPALVLIK